MTMGSNFRNIRCFGLTSPFDRTFTGSDFSDYLINTPGDFFDFNSDGLYLDNFLPWMVYAVNSKAVGVKIIIRFESNGVLNPYQGFTVRERTKADIFYAWSFLVMH